MSKLKLGAVIDEKPIKVSLELPAALHRDLRQYAEILAQQEGVAVAELEKLILAMAQRFIQTDRGFARARRDRTERTPGS
ncbi:DUF2274 domain-containing protein [Paracoccus nototheniae]|uniref:DUF2274 domain-containing protein n=1 Tax=Paracoccus nototheniae TaxID=2489002 RepID=A0ABW4DST8_9RHOB|nr:DUF2274 domain-containing protein [Paracoccus nototheniae]